jgi:hypothetical protein
MRARTLASAKQKYEGSPQSQDGGTVTEDKAAQGHASQKEADVDHIQTGPSRTGDVIGDEVAFVGVNKAIENRVCINLRRMRWAEPPRSMLVIEQSEGLSLPPSLPPSLPVCLSVCVICCCGCVCITDP